MRWLRFYAKIFCPLMGALSLVSGLILWVSVLTLLERAAAFFLLLHGVMGISAGLHLRMRHTPFSLFLQGLFPPGWIFCWRLLPILPLGKSFPKRFRAGSFRLLPSFSALLSFSFCFFCFPSPTSTISGNGATIFP